MHWHTWPGGPARPRRDRAARPTRARLARAVRVPEQLPLGRPNLNSASALRDSDAVTVTVTVLAPAVVGDRLGLGDTAAYSESPSPALPVTSARNPICVRVTAESESLRGTQAQVY